MNVKHLIAAASIALVGASAFAAEDVRWPDASTQVCQKTRAEVAAEVAQARQQGVQFEITEARSTPDVAVAGTRDRAEVRAEARAAARDSSTDRDYIGG